MDFTKIRPYEGSQHKGFEELVCQLAHLQKPEGAKAFIRKEGAGGEKDTRQNFMLIYRLLKLSMVYVQIRNGGQD